MVLNGISLMSNDDYLFMCLLAIRVSFQCGKCANLLHIFFPSPDDMLIDFRERGREGEKEEEKH